MDGRPIKIEGNAQHPTMRDSEPNELGEAGDKSRFASSGSDVFAQACILGLYDPDRASRVAKRVDGALQELWEDFTAYEIATRVVEGEPGCIPRDSHVAINYTVSKSFGRGSGQTAAENHCSSIFSRRFVAEKDAACQAAGKRLSCV